MHLLDQLGSRLLFTREYLKAGVFVSLLSVWILVALFYYLNLYTRRRYFTIWTAAWLFYALWTTLSFGAQGLGDHPILMMSKLWCVGVSAIFFLWGSLRFLGARVKTSVLGWFIMFLLAWSYAAAYGLRTPLELEVPVFTLIAIASWVTSGSFFRYRRKHPYVGATLLSAGFMFWGVFMAGYPFLENSEDLTSVALFIAAGLQLMLAVSMIILVLEEARQSHLTALEVMQSRKDERDALKTQVASSEERYQKLFDQAGEAIVITTDSFQILEINHAAERLLGATREEMGKESLKAYCQLKVEEGETVSNNADWFEKVCHQRPLQLTRKNGTLVPVEVNGARIDFGSRTAYQFFLMELTERARLEQQLRQSEKLSAIGQMISGIAHELNNPLAVVKGYLELVLSHHDLDTRTRADLEKAAHESNRAAKLVMNFLSFAREQSNHRELVNLSRLSRRVVELRQADLENWGVELILDLDNNLPLVSGDPDQIHQLIVNLMNNSIQAMAGMQRTAKLKISTKREDGWVQLLVEDNGAGVPPHLVNKIFEPFFTTKGVGKGTGLGLSIAHSLMREHHGRVYYQTSSMGGAGFILEFPKSEALTRKTPTEVVAASVAKPVVPGPARSGRILVLDDEKSIAEMLCEMLELLGYTATMTHTPTQALELISREEFDLVLSDFRMPEMNGRQFHARVAEQKPSLARRMIFLTGDVVNNETRSFLESIGNPHIAKPFNLNMVKGVVAEAIDANKTVPKA